LTSNVQQETPRSQPSAETKAPLPRQFVNFQFLRVGAEWRRLDEKARAEGKAEFAQLYQEYAKKMILLPYSMVGIRADCDFMLWRISYEIEAIQEFTARMLRTGFGRYLEPAYSYLAMTRRSVYIDKMDPSHSESRTQVKPGKYKYLFVYPFVKSRDWYLLPLEQRQGMMDEHIRIGNKYPSVKLNTTYSFGLDDQEFVVAFESDNPGDFLDLVMELRESQGSKYTVRDTPTFTCIAKPLEALLNDF
jgi:chlorite dismutase